MIHFARGVFREGFWGSKPLPFLGIFFNLLRVFKKKISLPYKKISNPLPRKISGYAPALCIPIKKIKKMMYGALLLKNSFFFKDRQKLPTVASLRCIS